MIGIGDTLRITSKYSVYYNKLGIVDDVLDERDEQFFWKHYKKLATYRVIIETELGKRKLWFYAYEIEKEGDIQ